MVQVGGGRCLRVAQAPVVERIVVALVMYRVGEEPTVNAVLGPVSGLIAALGTGDAKVLPDPVGSDTAGAPFVEVEIDPSWA
jgi:hypothetical protein